MWHIKHTEALFKIKAGVNPSAKVPHLSLDSSHHMCGNLKDDDSFMGPTSLIPMLSGLRIGTHIVYHHRHNCNITICGYIPVKVIIHVMAGN